MIRIIFVIAIIHASNMMSVRAQTLVKLYPQYQNPFTDPMVINDSTLMMGINHTGYKNILHASLCMFDSNGNFAPFREIYRVGYSADTHWLTIRNMHKSSDGDYYIFGNISNPNAEGLGFLLRLDAKGNKKGLNYYRGRGDYFFLHSTAYDTINNNFIITANTKDSHPDSYYSFVAKIDTNGNVIGYTTFKEIYYYINIIPEWDALILSSTDYAPTAVPSVDKASPYISMFRLSSLKQIWRHPKHFDDLNGQYGNNTYTCSDGSIYFNADIYTGMGYKTNNRLIKLDTVGNIIKYIKTSPDDSVVDISSGYLYNAKHLMEAGGILYDSVNWFWKFLIRKSDIDGRVSKVWIWDSFIHYLNFPVILRNTPHTNIVCFLLHKISFTPMVMMKFDEDLNRIPFDEAAPPVKFDNTGVSDTLYVDGGKDTTYMYNKTPWWGNIIDKTKYDKYNIYPNPSSGNFLIEGFFSFPQLICVYDILGRRVLAASNKNESTYNLQLETLPSGIYYISIGSSVQKVFKY